MRFAQFGMQMGTQMWAPVSAVVALATMLGCSKSPPPPTKTVAQQSPTRTPPPPPVPNMSRRAVAPSAAPASGAQTTSAGANAAPTTNVATSEASTGNPATTALATGGNPPPASGDGQLIEAEVGAGKKGRGYGGTILVEPLRALQRTKQRLAFDVQIPQAILLYKASHGKFPESHEQFMEEIIKKNQIELPELPEGQTYEYVSTYGKLMIRRPRDFSYRVKNGRIKGAKKK